MSIYRTVFCAGGCGRTATLRARDTKVWLCDSCGRATRSATAQAGRLLRNSREAAVPGARTAQTPMRFQQLSRSISRIAENAVARKLTALIPSRSSLWRVWVQRYRQIAGDAAGRRGRGLSSVPTALIAHWSGRARNLVALMLCGLLLAACDTGIRADADLGVREGQQLTAAQRDLLRAQMDGRAHREERPFYGAAVQVERGKVSGKPLPKAVEGARGIALRLAGQADIKSIAAAITAATDIPVNIRTRYVLPGENDQPSTSTVVDVPIGTRMTATYEGALSAFLDRLAARMDVGWSYDGTVITIDRMVRRTWRIALPLGETKYKDEKDLGSGGDGASGSGGDGPSDKGPSLEGPTITSSWTINQWDDLESRLKPLAPAPARVTLTPEAGRVEVFGPPSVQKAVGAVLEEVAATADTRIGLEVAIYFVDSERADQFGVGIMYEAKRVAATTTETKTTGPVATTDEGSTAVGGTSPPMETTITSSLGVFARGASGGSLILSTPNIGVSFEALSEDSAVVDYRLASAVAQSGVIIPIAITDAENYVYSKTVEQNDQSNGNENSGSQNNISSIGSTSYDIKTLETGLHITALPRLINERKIHLSLTVDQNIGTIKHLVDGIQTPDIRSREFRNQTVLSPGETLVLSGYEQDVASRGDSGLGLARRIGLGGKTEAARKKVRMIVMVRPTLIPARPERGQRGGRS